MIPSPDYDRLAPTYDQRFEIENDAGLPAFVTDLLSRHSGRWLEVGCGTGRWLSLGRPRQAFGLDRSWGMLAQARARLVEGQLAQGVASRLPFDAESFGLVLCVHAIHHFPDLAGFVLEAVRVLQPGGSLVVAGLDAHDPELSWYVYEYFEGVRATDLRRYPSWPGLATRLEAAGLRLSDNGRAEAIRSELRGSQVLGDPFLQAHSTSQLALLSQEAYQAGRQRIEHQLALEPQAVFRTRIDVRYLKAVLP